MNSRLIKPGRLAALALIAALLLSVYMYFLYQLMIVRGEEYYNRANELSVTKRTVFYAGKNIRFADIRWNRDETYTVDFGDETFDAVRNDANSFSFFADDASIGKISRDVSGVSGIVKDDVRYEPSYTVEYDENISQQVLIMIMVFPILYFGF